MILRSYKMNYSLWIVECTFSFKIEEWIWCTSFLIRSAKVIWWCRYPFLTRDTYFTYTYIYSDFAIVSASCSIFDLIVHAYVDCVFINMLKFKKILKKIGSWVCTSLNKKLTESKWGEEKFSAESWIFFTWRSVARVVSKSRFSIFFVKCEKNVNLGGKSVLVKRKKNVECIEKSTSLRIPPP